MPRSMFVPRLAQLFATQPRGGGPRRTGSDHRVGHAAVAAAGPPVVAVVAASRVRHHAAPRTRHPAHVVATRPDARLQGPPAQDHRPGHRPRAGRLGRGPSHHLQPGARRGHRTGRRRSDAVHRRRRHNRQDRRAALVRVRRPAARSPRRRHHHQEPRPRPDTRYTVTFGRQVRTPRRVSPSHGKRQLLFFFSTILYARARQSPISTASSS